MTILHQHDDVFDDRNAFLQATLGLVSLCRHFGELTLVMGPSLTGPRPSAGEAPDSFLYLVLGLASLARQTVVHLEGAADLAAPPAEDVGSPATRSEAPDMRRLLA